MLIIKELMESLLFMINLLLIVLKILNPIGSMKLKSILFNISYGEKNVSLLLLGNKSDMDGC